VAVDAEEAADQVHVVVVVHVVQLLQPVILQLLPTLKKDRRRALAHEEVK
jgi:hypothetical protein